MAEIEKTIPYWPYCENCKLPYSFDVDEPFAHCGCGTCEWGYPRPADYVQEPTAAWREFAQVVQRHPCPDASVAMVPTPHTTLSFPWTTQHKPTPTQLVQEAHKRMLEQAGTDDKLATDLGILRRGHWTHWSAQENHVVATAVRVLLELGLWRDIMLREFGPDDAADAGEAPPQAVEWEQARTALCRRQGRGIEPRDVQDAYMAGAKSTPPSEGRSIKT